MRIKWSCISSCLNSWYQRCAQWYDRWSYNPGLPADLRLPRQRGQIVEIDVDGDACAGFRWDGQLVNCQSSCRWVARDDAWIHKMTSPMDDAAQRCLCIKTIWTKQRLISDEMRFDIIVNCVYFLPDIRIFNPPTVFSIRKKNKKNIHLYNA